MEQYGSQEAVLAGMRRGCPQVGSPTGASPTVRDRISDTDYAAFTQLQHTTGRTQAELVREAVDDLLIKHRAAS